MVKTKTKVMMRPESEGTMTKRIVKEKDVEVRMGTETSIDLKAAVEKEQGPKVLRKHKMR